MPPVPLPRKPAARPEPGRRVHRPHGGLVYGNREAARAGAEDSRLQLLERDAVLKVFPSTAGLAVKMCDCKARPHPPIRTFILVIPSPLRGEDQGEGAIFNSPNHTITKFFEVRGISVLVKFDSLPLHRFVNCSSWNLGRKLACSNGRNWNGYGLVCKAF